MHAPHTSPPPRWVRTSGAHSLPATYNTRTICWNMLLPVQPIFFGVTVSLLAIASGVAVDASPLADVKADVQNLFVAPDGFLQHATANKTDAMAAHPAARRLQAGTDDTNCRQLSLKFIVQEGDAELQAMEDDIRSDLAAIGITVETEMLTKDAFNAAMTSGAFNL